MMPENVKPFLFSLTHMASFYSIRKEKKMKFEGSKISLESYADNSEESS